MPAGGGPSAQCGLVRRQRRHHLDKRRSNPGNRAGRDRPVEHGRWRGESVFGCADQRREFLPIETAVQHDVRLSVRCSRIYNFDWRSDGLRLHVAGKSQQPRRRRQCAGQRPGQRAAPHGRTHATRRGPANSRTRFRLAVRADVSERHELQRSAGLRMGFQLQPPPGRANQRGRSLHQRPGPRGSLRAQHQRHFQFTERVLYAAEKKSRRHLRGTRAPWHDQFLFRAQRPRHRAAQSHRRPQRKPDDVPIQRRRTTDQRDGHARPRHHLPLQHERAAHERHGLRRAHDAIQL